MTYGRAPKAPKNTGGEAMAIAAAGVEDLATAEAGSVDINLPAGAPVPIGGIFVDSSDAGSVKSTGAPGVPSTGLGAADGNSRATGGCTVTTIRAGSVITDGQVKNVDTRSAGAVKIVFSSAQLVMPATAAGGDNTHTPGGENTGAIGAGTGGGSTTGATLAVAGGNNGQEGATVSNVAAAALDLFDLAYGDKLRAFLVIAGAAEMHARGAIGRRILYASLAMLLVSIAVHYGWKKLIVN